jgi:probable F420-dependent oxidoreductase
LVPTPYDVLLRGVHRLSELVIIDPPSSGASMRAQLGRVGVWARRPQLDGKSPNELREIGAGLEAAGYGALWVGASKADLAAATPILDATSRLVYATGIINVWTEPAAEVAASYHRVTAVHPDRLLVGVGAGHREATSEYQRPLERLTTYLDALAAADPPVPAEATALAALGPRVLRLAGERTAGAHPYLVTPEHTRTARQTLGPGPLLAPEQKVVLETDPAKARDFARASVGFYLELSNYLANLRRLGFTDDDFADHGSDRLIDAVVAWGDADSIAARVAEHHAAGADHVCVQMLSEGGFPLRQLQLLAPALAA